MFVKQYKIAQVAFGNIWKVKERATDREMVCKTIDLRKLPSICNECLFETYLAVKQIPELNIPSSNLMPLIGAIKTEEKVHIFMPFMAGGDLCNYIIDNGPLSECHCRNLFKQILKAVKTLHDISIVHRDIKPENMMFEDEECTQLRLGDYGNACIISKTGKASGYFGTRGYIAPEVLKQKDQSFQSINKPYTNACDIWSLGASLYVMVRGRKADWDNKTWSEDNEYGFNSQDPFWLLYPSLYHLLKRMLTINPAKRITMDSIMNHKWLRELCDCER